MALFIIVIVSCRGLLRLAYRCPCACRRLFPNDAGLPKDARLTILIVLLIHAPTHTTMNMNAEQRQAMTIALWVILISGCLIGMISFGIRSSFGLFVDPVSGPAGFDYGRETFAFALALQNLFWGLGQPLAGALADRFGPWKVMAGGGLIFAAGLALMSVSSTPGSIALTAGILVGLGMSGAGHNTVMAAFAQVMPTSRRAWAMGLAASMASLGQFLIVPLGQAFIDAYGWVTAILILATAMATTPALALSMRRSGSTSQSHAQASITATAESFRQSLQQAFGHGSYWLLMGGFFVCGFQLAFITAHFPSYLVDKGISASTASWGLAMIGLFNIVGSYLSGPLSDRWSRKTVLALIYFLRAVVITLFLLAPLSGTTVLIFGAAMGVLWLSTVPPTAQLVSIMFGNRYLSMLFGFVFLSHQLGGFAGVWLGGQMFAASGSYLPIWWGAVALGIAAALLNLPIREQLWVPRANASSAARVMRYPHRGALLLMLSSALAGVLIWIGVQSGRPEQLPTLVWSAGVPDARVIEASPMVLDRLGQGWWWVYAAPADRERLRDQGVRMALALPTPLAQMAGCSLPAQVSAR